MAVVGVGLGRWHRGWRLGTSRTAVSAGVRSSAGTERPIDLYPRATASYFQQVNNTLSRYSSFAAHLLRLISIPFRQLVSRFSRPRTNRRITLRLAGP